MRTFLTGESAIVGGTLMRNALRVKIANGSGTLIDYSAYVTEVSIDHDIDQLSAGFSLSIWRDIGANSLAPLREDSTFNRLNDGVTYSPAIDVARRVTIETATVAVSASPSGTDWKLVFDGTIDDVDSASPVIQINGRDRIVADLLDRWTPTGTAFGVATDPLETVMQGFLDFLYTDILYGGGTAPTLYVPTSPLFELAKPFTFDEPISGMDALKAMADAKGWGLASRYDETSGTFKLTLYDPLRTKTVPDYTFSATRYIDVKKLYVNRSEIRNGGWLEYLQPGATTVSIVVATATAAIVTSRARYGYRPLFMREESSTSPIDTAIEAQALFDSIMLDTADPKAEHEIELHYFWAVELGDLLRFTANSVHYTSDQDWAVTNILHTLSDGNHRTTVTARGKPATGFYNWIGKGGLPTTPPSDDPAYQLIDFGPAGETNAVQIFKIEKGALVDEVWAAYKTFPRPAPENPDGLFAEVMALLAPLDPAATTWEVPWPADGYFTLGQVEARDADAVVHQVNRVRVDSQNTGRPSIISVRITGTVMELAGDVNVKSWKVDHSGGTWEYNVNGQSVVIDTSLAGNGGTGSQAGQGADTSWPVEITAYAEPIGYIDGATKTDVRSAIVLRGSPTPPATVWDAVPFLTAPTGIGTVMKINLDASVATGTTVITLRRDLGNGYESVGDITADVTRSSDATALTTPPASATDYNYTTLNPRSASPIYPVRYEITAEIWDGATLLDTKTSEASWYVGAFT